MDKKHLRNQLKKLRGGLGEEKRIELSDKIWKNVEELEEFKRAKKIGVYLDFGSEVKTTSYLLNLIGEKEVFIPRLRGKEMDFVAFGGLDGMKAGAFGILEPLEGEICPPEELELILVPGLGFTLKGGRLGYGGGYYDTYLPATKAPLFALGFEVQIRDTLPLESWDYPIDGLVSEKDIYRF